MKTITLRLLAATALTALAACSTYNGPVTNRPDQADTNGPPLLTNGFAP